MKPKPKTFDGQGEGDNIIQPGDVLPEWHNDAHKKQQELVRDQIVKDGGNPEEIPDFMKDLEKPKGER